MASLKAVILLHLLLLILSHNLVSADESLIRRECHNADVPSICKQAKTLAANMTSLASNTEDSKMKSLFNDCAPLCSSTEDKLTLAKTALEIHKYDETERSVVEALKSDVECHNRIPTRRQSQIYRQVVFQINIYEGLSDAALRIIERF